MISRLQRLRDLIDKRDDSDDSSSDINPPIPSKSRRSKSSSKNPPTRIKESSHYRGTGDKGREHNREISGDKTRSRPKGEKYAEKGRTRYNSRNDDKPSHRNKYSSSKDRSHHHNHQPHHTSHHDAHNKYDRSGKSPKESNTYNKYKGDYKADQYKSPVTQTKTSLYPSLNQGMPYKSIHDQVYKNSSPTDYKYKLNLSSSSSEDTLDKYMESIVTKTRRNVRDAIKYGDDSDDSLSTTTDTLHINQVLKRYRYPSVGSKATKPKHTTKTIREIIESSSSSSDNEFALKRPVINKRGQYTSYARQIAALDSSSDDIDDIVSPYTTHLKHTTKKYSANTHKYDKRLIDLSESSDSLSTGNKKFKYMNLSDSETDSDLLTKHSNKYSNKYSPKYSTKSKYDKSPTLSASKKYKFISSSDDSDVKNLSTSSSIDEIQKKFELNKYGKKHNESPLQSIKRLLSSDSDSIDDIIRNRKLSPLKDRISPKKNQGRKSYLSDSDESGNIDFTKLASKRRTNDYLGDLDSDEISKKRKALKNVFDGLSDDESSSDIFGTKALHEETRRLLSDRKKKSSTTDKRKPQDISQKPKLAISKPIEAHSPKVARKPISDSENDSEIISNNQKKKPIENKKKPSENKKNIIDDDSSSSTDKLIQRYSKKKQNKNGKSALNLSEGEDSSSTDELLNKYSNVIANNTDKKNKKTKNNDYDIPKPNVLSSDQDINFQSNSDSIPSDLPNTQAPSLSKTNQKESPSNKQEKVLKKNEKNDDLSSDLNDEIEKFTKKFQKLDQEISQSTKSSESKPEKTKTASKIISSSSSEDIIDENINLEKKFQALKIISDNSEDDEEIDTNCNDLQSKISSLDKKIEKILSSSDDEESPKKKYEALKWKSSSEAAISANEEKKELKKADDISSTSSTSSDEIQNIPNEQENINIKIGRSESNDIRVEDDIQDNISSSSDGKTAENMSSPSKKFSPMLFTYNSPLNTKSDEPNVQPPEVEEEMKDLNDQQQIDETSSSRTPKKMNLPNPLIIPGKESDNFQMPHNSSGVATPIRSPEDKIPTFNSDDSDDVFGLTAPSPKTSVTPSPFASDDERDHHDGSITPKKKGFPGKPQQQNRPHERKEGLPPIPHSSNLHPTDNQHSDDFNLNTSDSMKTGASTASHVEDFNLDENNEKSENNNELAITSTKVDNDTLSDNDVKIDISNVENNIEKDETPTHEAPKTKPPMPIPRRPPQIPGLSATAGLASFTGLRRMHRSNSTASDGFRPVLDIDIAFDESVPAMRRATPRPSRQASEVEDNGNDYNIYMFEEEEEEGFDDECVERDIVIDLNEVKIIGEENEEEETLNIGGRPTINLDEEEDDEIIRELKATNKSDDDEETLNIGGRPTINLDEEEDDEIIRELKATNKSDDEETLNIGGRPTINLDEEEDDEIIRELKATNDAENLKNILFGSSDEDDIDLDVEVDENVDIESLLKESDSEEEED